MVHVLARGHYNLHWWSFSMTNQRRYSILAHVVVATVTCTGGGLFMTNCHRYSTGTGGGGCDIVVCTVWWWWLCSFWGAFGAPILFSDLGLRMASCSYIYIYIYIYIPPPPPPHSASYNITATTTCASRVSATVGHRKRPPVQVTVATTTCASRVSALVGHRKRPQCKLQWLQASTCTHHSHHHMCQKVNALNG